MSATATCVLCGATIVRPRYCTTCARHLAESAGHIANRLHDLQVHNDELEQEVSDLRVALTDCEAKLAAKVAP